MSAIEIPHLRIKSFALRPRLFSGEQEGALGGPDLPIPRPGDRLAADVATTQFRNDAEGRLMIAALFEASNSSAIMRIVQPNRGGRSPGYAAVVDGNDQGGMTLALRGLQPGGTLTRGNFFSIVHGGQRYVHMIACPGQMLVPDTGRVALPIWPMLRFLTVDAEPAEFVAPMIEGKLLGFDKGASFVRAKTETLSFSIQERA
ncbi:hypothetical protein [Sphingomonas sp. ACRSK]|uniref:hypothetical protein n=1 Tax=Sphingomonas sp. ACRSK TaxID=2918213 RepID=UPI001EF70A0F|nr:hypothetical protein [Sphingomonas sp. ACRSK]MCG7349796.1 hypothetical protein [Sphingomonas sp. ACRSK]